MGGTERLLDQPSEAAAAAANANILVGESSLPWRSITRLGLGAITYALLDLADAIRGRTDG